MKANTRKSISSHNHKRDGKTAGVLPGKMRIHPMVLSSLGSRAPQAAFAVVVGGQVRQTLPKRRVAQRAAAARRAPRGGGAEAETILAASSAAFAEDATAGAEQLSPAAAAASVAASTTPPTDTSAATGETSDAIQALLSKVFDEDLNKYYENPLKGLEPIQIDALAQFSQQIAAQLRTFIITQSGG